MKQKDFARAAPAAEARLRRICLAMALFCFVAAAWRGGSVLLPLAAPGWSAPGVVCNGLDCRGRSDLVDLLPASVRPQAWRDPAAPALLAREAARPRGRALLTAAAVVYAIPAVLIFLALAMAFLRFASRAPFGAQAIRWLRRAAAGGVVLALAHPVAATLRATALMPALGEPRVVFVFEANAVVGMLFLSAATWAAVWALEQGRTLREDLAGYV
jgi:hypothetical protein